jgi:hypothetical protein
MGDAVAAARQRDVGGSLAAALRRQQRQRRWRRRTARRWQRGGSSAVAAAVAAVAVVEAVEENLSAAAAGNESVDGRMTACDDEIGRWTTTRRPDSGRRIRRDERGGRQAPPPHVGIFADAGEGQRHHVLLGHGHGHDRRRCGRGGGSIEDVVDRRMTGRDGGNRLRQFRAVLTAGMRGHSLH